MASWPISKSVFWTEGLYTPPFGGPKKPRKMASRARPKAPFQQPGTASYRHFAVTEVANRRSRVSDREVKLSWMNPS